MNLTKKEKGVTMVEILVVLAILMILITASTIILNPVEKKARARDNKRFSDINTLDRMINEYLIDNGSYPDLENTLRESDTLPTGNISVDNASDGWIDTDLSEYHSRLPTDPINDAIYKYYYYHNASSYELNAVLEHSLEFAQDDGGDDLDRYEIGNDLTLISP